VVWLKTGKPFVSLFQLYKYEIKRQAYRAVKTEGSASARLFSITDHYLIRVT
jgi:hypothetical protein